MKPLSVDRRAFLEGIALAGTFCVLPMALHASRATAAQAAPKPQMALHLDYPYYDRWGTGAPYVPPRVYGAQARLQPHQDFGRYFSYV
jgi:hypothetical protein